MKNCRDLYFLSTIACQLADCLSEEELILLSSSLNTLGDMLAVISAKQAFCNTQPQNEKMKTENP